MKPQLLRKNFFIILFFGLFMGCLYVSDQGNRWADLGINLFSIVAHLVALVWMMNSYHNIKDKQRYFWLFFGLGICFLLIGKIVSTYERMHLGRMMHVSTEDSLRLIGYLFFFIGFMFEIKVLKNTIPMLRFLLNIIIVITAVYSLSWQYVVNPILEGNQEVTNIGFLISSITHAFNISLLFAAVCLIFLFKHEKKKTSFYLIAIGFFIQVVGDFFYINHFYVKEWIFALWPMSALFMGLGAVYTNEYPWKIKKEEKLEYNNYFITILSAGVLLIFTFYNQENNVVEKGLLVTVFLLLIQQTLAGLENKNMFKKLKQIALTDGNLFLEESQEDQQEQENEIGSLLKKIENLAHYDPLTHLPNRNLFQTRMEQEIKKAKANHSSFSLMYIDLDRFKYVNDSLGHDCGDLLLKKVAVRLKESVGKAATVARIGGDEFAIILPESNPVRLEQIANEILHRFEGSFDINGHLLYSTPSMGITVYPEGGKNMKELLKSADAAMYLAKEEGKNNFKFFNHKLNEIITKKIQVETRLRAGLEDNNFSLYYQPQVELRTEKTIGFEALLRWNDPELGMVSPVDFIPIAEETGLIDPIGKWVLETACRQLKQWQQMGLLNVSMSVNASIRQFQNPNFIQDVKNILAETNLNPKYLKIEITESMLQNINKTKKILDQLRELGIQIAIDDFGTGYSSLSYLKNLPVSCLKIDKAFIDELSVNKEGPIVKTIIDMGRNMNFMVIAEGIESSEHVDFLQNHQCFVGQGYLFSKPMPAADIEQFMQEKKLKIS